MLRYGKYTAGGSSALDGRSHLQLETLVELRQRDTIVHTVAQSSDEIHVSSERQGTENAGCENDGR